MKCFVFSANRPAGCKGCTGKAGICGKKSDTAHLQDKITGALIRLAEAFGCGVNDLPLQIVLSWYEQKAVCVLFTLLHLGIRNILLESSLPAFISPNVLKYLAENYSIAPISTPEEDLKRILG